MSEALHLTLEYGRWADDPAVDISAMRWRPPPDEAEACRKWVGPVWKLGGETCVCMLRADHADGRFGADHECECGSWFADEAANPSGGLERKAHRS